MVKVYRKDYLTGYEIGDDVKVIKKYAENGYTQSLEEATAESVDIGGQNYAGSVTDKETTAGDYTEGLERAKALYKFMPENVQAEFANAWVKFGEVNLAKQATRNTAAWKKEFKYLERDDGSLIMDELQSMATKATYRETLSEVGIADTSEFEEQFNQLINGEVSGAEFQQRIDVTYNAVKNNIPEVEAMFREQYNISTDQPTIFAALINPSINDKLLKGDLLTIGIGAEAKAAGFSRSFNRFESLRKAGLTQDKAKQVYEQAGNYQTMATQTNSQFDVSTLEDASIGDANAAKELGLLAAESAAMSSFKSGAAKKDGKVTGLLEE
tara:strand:- start:434 stop:1411 length:978 start_codon:yes stop_codon:yes gene_type:complete